MTFAQLRLLIDAANLAPDTVVGVRIVDAGNAARSELFPLRALKVVRELAGANVLGSVTLELVADAKR